MKKQLPNYALYLVTESNLAKNRSNTEIVEQAIAGGATIIQLREKDWSKEQYAKEAEQLAKLCKEKNVLFVVNDYPDIAKQVQADGLHLGQEDMPIEQARKIAGPDIFIGKSTHSKQQALAAQEERADYISIGPVFPTRKKPNPVGTELIAQVLPELTIPFVAIGGIKLHNLDSVLQSGAKTVAVISALVEADDIQEQAQQFKQTIDMFREESK